MALTPVYDTAVFDTAIFGGEAPVFDIGTMFDSAVFDGATSGISASLASQLAALTASSAGSIKLKAGSSVTLANAISDSVSRVQVRGIGAGTLGDCVSSSASVLSIKGEFVQALEDVQALSVAVLPISAGASLSLEDVTASSSAFNNTRASLGAVLENAICAAQAEITQGSVQGQSAIGLEDAFVLSEAQLLIIAGLVRTLSDVTVSATSTMPRPPVYRRSAATTSGQDSRKKMAAESRVRPGSAQRIKTNASGRPGNRASFR